MRGASKVSHDQSLNHAIFISDGVYLRRTGAEAYFNHARTLFQQHGPASKQLGKLFLRPLETVQMQEGLNLSTMD